MINVERVEGILRQRYPDLQVLRDGVYRGVDRYAAHDYAIRYFDINDRLTETAPLLKRYQEELLSSTYFSSQTPTDLRWSHYLYFVTSAEQARRSDFGHFKAAVEADREYARKRVLLEGELGSLFGDTESTKPSSHLPADLATTWMKRLDAKGLGFVLDEGLSVPEVVRRITAGQKETATKVVSPMALLPEEAAAARHFLTKLTIRGFRPYPAVKQHSLGRVNLIVGTNAVGKTSLLEAIEYAYCGKNRRHGGVAASTSVTLAMEGTKATLSSTSELARRRARHAHWYAKTELKTVTIESSFGKFNFLDTDAAVRLTVATSAEQIGADVARLVLGAEAEKLSDRLRRVREKLEEELKGLKRDAETNEQLTRSAQSRLDALTKAPKLSDGLFAELVVALQQLGWQRLPAVKSAVEDLRIPLQESGAAVTLLQRLGTDILWSDEKSLEQLANELADAARRANELDEHHKSATLRLAEEQRNTQASSGRVAAIEALVPYVQAGFEELLTRQQVLQQDINDRSVKLSVVRVLPSSEEVAHVLTQPVDTAESSAINRMEELRSKLQSVQASLRTLEATQNSLAVLRQRVLAAARELLQQAPNPDHCPVCHTEFEKGQLMVRMLDDSGADVSGPGGDMQAEISTLEAEIASSEATTSSLRPLKEFLGARGASVTVAEALAIVERERAALDKDVRELATVRDQLDRLRSNGLTASDLAQKLVAAGLTAPWTDTDLQNARTTAQGTLANLRAEVERVQKELSALQQGTESMAARFSLKLSATPDEIARHIRGRLTDLETAVKARQTLFQSLKVRVGGTLEGISVDLAAARDLLVRLVTADASENADNAALASEKKTIDDLEKTRKECTSKIGNLNEADAILAELSTQNSGTALAAAILADNALQIGQTFGKIHVPNEFDLKAENGALQIIRRQSGAAVEPGEMSSGQRAAFALALFLAMNSRLQSGPPVLLFDDPVAHVDDINVLSFLDYLRELAIKGSRQIFFATADTKLAGLFRHKFQFLGSEAFREMPLTRE